MNKDYDLIFERIKNIEELIMSSAEKLSHSSKPTVPNYEWMSLKEAAKYAGVSHNTFVKFRVMGLRVSEIDGVKRVSRKEIDQFLESHSF